MISNIVNDIKQQIESLNIFCELSGLVKPIPIKDKILPFSCELSLDECKVGTEIAPSNKNKLVGFFEQVGIVNELESFAGYCGRSLYKGNISFVVWYNCDSVKITNKGVEIDCCNKQGYIQEKIITAIKATTFTNDVLLTVVLGVISISDYNFGKYNVLERLKHHPFYAFEVSIPVEFILNTNCSNGLDIEITKEVC